MTIDLLENPDAAFFWGAVGRRAAALGLLGREILDRSDRRPAVVQARRAVFAECRAVRMSATVMSRISGVAHSTISSALREFDAQVKRDTAFAAAMKEGPDQGLRVVMDEDKELQTVRCGLTPIDRLVKAQSLPGAAGLASRRFHVDYQRAHGSGFKSQLARYSGKTGLSDPDRREAAQLDAQKAVRELLGQLTASQGSVLVHTCGQDLGLSEWAFAAGVPKKAALGILYTALESTARYYALRWPQPRKPEPRKAA